MILTKPALLEHIESGHIVADKDLVQENSINVRLGDELWAPKETGTLVNLHENREYEPLQPVPDWVKEADGTLSSVLGFIFMPRKFYIGTTLGDIGSVNKGDGVVLVPKMQARSTTGRHGLTVALCAGLGDVGYSSRWALEIVNNGPDPVFVGIGTQIGQVFFSQGTPISPEDSYDGPTRYQHAGTVRFLPKPFEIPPQNEQKNRE